MRKKTIDVTLKEVIRLSEEKVPFAQLDKISYEISKSLLDTPKDGFKLVDKLWKEVRNKEVKSNIDLLKISAMVVVLSNILGILSQKDFDKSIGKIERYNIEGGAWYITDNLATRAVRHCYSASQDKLANRVETWIKNKNKWHRRLGIVSALVGVKYCDIDVEWCLNILQDMIPQEELIVNKAIA
ncbi:MAG: DNA alkylation repair protein [bacterium]